MHFFVASASSSSSRRKTKTTTVSTGSNNNRNTQTKNIKKNEEKMQFYEYMGFYTAQRTTTCTRHDRETENTTKSLPRVNVQNEFLWSFFYGLFYISTAFSLFMARCFFSVVKFEYVSVPLHVGMHTSSNCSCFRKNIIPFFFCCVIAIVVVTVVASNRTVFNERTDNCMLVDTFSMHNLRICSGRSTFRSFFYSLFVFWIVNENVLLSVSKSFVSNLVKSMYEWNFMFVFFERFFGALWKTIPVHSFFILSLFLSLQRWKKNQNERKKRKFSIFHNDIHFMCNQIKIQLRLVITSRHPRPLSLHLFDTCMRCDEHIF